MRGSGTEICKNHALRYPLSMANRGFTLVELLIVVSIVAVVAGGSLFVIDPVRRIHTAHNSVRWADSLVILSSIKRYQADNDGALPASGTIIDDADGTVQIIGTGVGTCASVTCPGHVVASANCGLESIGQDLRPYLKDLPIDPTLGTLGNTRYYANKDIYGILSVGACNEEGEGQGGSGLPPVIEVTK